MQASHRFFAFTWGYICTIRIDKMTENDPLIFDESFHLLFELEFRNKPF